MYREFEFESTLVRYQPLEIHVAGWIFFRPKFPPVLEPDFSVKAFRCVAVQLLRRESLLNYNALLLYGITGIGVYRVAVLIGLTRIKQCIGNCVSSLRIF